MLSPIHLPGLFITATDTGVGKTLVAGAIADRLRRQGLRVGVLKPVATGCVKRREGLVSEDAEFLAACADARVPLDVICPNRYAEPLSPNVAADRAQRPVEWDAIQRSIRMIVGTSDVIIVEGAGGILTPIDDGHSMLDLARWIGLPTVVVARPSLGTINHTALTVAALKQAGVRVAGVVVNGYPNDTPSVAEETNPRQIEKWAKTKVLAIVPRDAMDGPTLTPNVRAPVDAVDWESFARVGD
jgi:dethiobiotin synthetase